MAVVQKKVQQSLTLVLGDFRNSIVSTGCLVDPITFDVATYYRFCTVLQMRASIDGR